MTTPPGWYPDPGHTGSGPAAERWWDGSGWTAHTRPSPDAHGPAAVHPSSLLPPTRERPSRGPLVAAVIATAVVLTALVAGVLLLLGGSGGSGGLGEPDDRTARSGPAPGDGESPEAGGAPGGEPGDSGGPEGGGDGPGDDIPGTAVDRANGVSVPVPDGWRETETPQGLWLATGSYDCPGDRSLTCVHAGVSLRPADGPAGATAREVAEKDIARHAEESYSSEGYGGISSHEVVTSGDVAVAGTRGHRVRWRVANELKPDAYVETVAFPAPNGSGRMLVLRLGFDIHDDAPDTGVMDRIVAGVRAVGSPGSGMEV